MSQCRSSLDATMHPNSKRVNMDKSSIADRPPPPRTAPPSAPFLNSNAVCGEITTTASFEVSPTDTVKIVGSPSSTKLPSDFDEDECSTLFSRGLSSAESASEDEDACSSQCSHVAAEIVVSRETLLYHRALSLRTTCSSPPKGLHTVFDEKCSRARGATSKFAPPPGLAPPAPKVAVAPAGFAPPPGLGGTANAGPCLQAVAPPSYTPAGFRKERMSILKDLAADRNVARAVRCVRAQGVPKERQAVELADIVTYTLEEPRGPARRLYVAFVAGLAGVFEKAQYAAGFGLFFGDVYQDLQGEVPKLAKLVNIELVPTLRSVFTPSEMRAFLPEEFGV